MGIALGLGIGPSITTYGSAYAGLYTSSYVKTNAGVTSGVTPGYTGSVGITGAVNASFSGVLIDEGNGVGWGEAPFYDGFTTGNGTTVGTPYTYDSVDFDSMPTIYGFDACAIDLIATTTRHLLFTNCRFRGNTAGDIHINLSASSTVRFVNCTFDGTAASLQGPRVLVESGSVTFTSCTCTNLSVGGSTAFVRKAGANANVTLTDFYLDNTAGATWTGGGLFENSVAGGAYTFTRCTIDHRSTGPLWDFRYGCTLTVDRMLYNPTRHANGRGLICTNTDNLLAAWTQTTTITDSRFYTGSATSWGSFFGGVSGAVSGRGVSNWTWSHCEIIAHTSGYPRPLILLGDSVTTSTTHTANNTFSFCRFSNPISAGVDTERVIMLGIRVANFTVIGCWIDEGGEDGYEFIQPLQNVSVTYSGGGDNGGAGRVNGNMVDFYNGGSATPWGSGQGNLGGHTVQYIFGVCGSDAIIVEAVHGITIDHIDIDNSADNSTSAVNIAIANVRLHTYGGAQPLNGTSVGRDISSVAKSVDGIRVMMTYENAGARTACQSPNEGTGSWYEYTGGAWVARTVAEGDSTPHTTG